LLETRAYVVDLGQYSWCRTTEVGASFCIVVSRFTWQSHYHTDDSTNRGRERDKKTGGQIQTTTQAL